MRTCYKSFINQVTYSSPIACQSEHIFTGKIKNLLWCCSVPDIKYHYDNFMTITNFTVNIPMQFEQEALSKLLINLNVLASCSHLLNPQSLFFLLQTSPLAVIKKIYINFSIQISCNSIYILE